MKLQRVETRRGNTVYEKFQVVIPTSIAEKMQWNKGDEVEFTINRNGRVVMWAHQPEPKPKKLTYEEAREILFFMLHSHPQGFTWTQIHEKAPRLPIKPSPWWVLRFVTDLGLVREDRDGRMIWQIPGADRPSAT